MRGTLTSRLPPVFAAAAALLLCGPVHAETATAAKPPAATAEELFLKAKALVAAGDFANGCPLFAESYALDPQVGALLNVAACYEGEGRTASAWAFWEKSAEIAAAKEEPERAAFARSRAQALESRLLRVTISVAPQPGEDRIALTVDHVPLLAAEWAVARPMDPGEHEIEAHGAGLASWSSRFVVTEGQVPSVVVPVLEPTRPAEAPTTTRLEKPERHVAVWVPTAWTLGGAGLAALSVGAAFGIASIVNNDASTENRNCVGLDCNPTGRSDLARARQDERIADASYAIGGAALVGAAVLWLVARTLEHPARPARIFVQPAVSRSAWSLSVDGAW